MNLICKLFGHKWLRCICLRCHEKRDENHQWGVDKESCICVLCGARREHEWDHCKCKICGRLRDEDHDWDGCTCRKCGAVRDEEHDYNNCRCVKCRKMLDNPRHYWKSHDRHGVITVQGKQTVSCANCNQEVTFDAGSPYATKYYCPHCFTEGEWEFIPTEDRMFLTYRFTCSKCGYRTGYEHNDSY